MSGQYWMISSTMWNLLEFHSNASSGQRTKLSFMTPSAAMKLGMNLKLKPRYFVIVTLRQNIPLENPQNI